MKDAIVKLDVDDSITSIVQPPRKIPQAMINPLKQEIEQMIKLGVIRKLDINEATDWCHNLVIVCKSNGKLKSMLRPQNNQQGIKSQHPQHQDLSRYHFIHQESVKSLQNWC